MSRWVSVSCGPGRPQGQPMTGAGRPPLPTVPAAAPPRRWSRC